MQISECALAAYVWGAERRVTGVRRLAALEKEDGGAGAWGQLKVGQTEADVQWLASMRVTVTPPEFGTLNGTSLGIPC